MSPSPRIQRGETNKIYFITITTIGWIDVFTNESYFDLLKNSLQHCIAEKGLILHEYVFMTNHIHLIAGASEKSQGLDAIIRDFKSFTTHEIKKLLKDDNRKYILKLLAESSKKKKENKFQIWQRENYPEELYSDDFTNQKIQYIWDNPVKKGYVKNPEDWLYSSARQKLLELPSDHTDVVLACDEWEI
jgi:REP element-mobilizing transposase RayT